MKKLIIIVCFCACGVAFGQTSAPISNTLPYREYAQGAVPLAHKAEHGENGQANRNMNWNSNANSHARPMDFEQVYPGASGTRRGAEASPRGRGGRKGNRWPNGNGGLVNAGTLVSDPSVAEIKALLEKKVALAGVNPRQNGDEKEPDRLEGPGL